MSVSTWAKTLRRLDVNAEAFYWKRRSVLPKTFRRLR